MKRRRFLATISIILALLMALSSTSAALESTADFIQEVTTAATLNEDDSFEQPEKVLPSNDASDINEQSAVLRFPDVQSS